MKLQEIFKDSPELLEHPEVKKLIEYVSDQHKRSYKICKSYQDFHFRTLDKIMHSEIVLIDGRPSKEVLGNIMQDINDSDL
jgi:hypothetical protein